MNWNFLDGYKKSCPAPKFNTQQHFKNDWGMIETIESSMMDFEHNSSVFLSNSGPVSEMDIIKQFLPNELIEDINCRTNIYFIEKTQNTPEADHKKRWLQLTPVEFYQYLDILIMMRIDKKPELTMH